jgi:hypothetical protein
MAPSAEASSDCSRAPTPQTDNTAAQKGDAVRASEDEAKLAQHPVWTAPAREDGLPGKMFWCSDALVGCCWCGRPLTTSLCQNEVVAGLSLSYRLGYLER